MIYTKVHNTKYNIHLYIYSILRIKVVINER